MSAVSQSESADGVRLSSQSGMTIVELSIGMVVSLIVMGGVIQMQVAARNGFTSSLSETRLNAEIREGMSEVKSELRSALVASIQVPAGGGNGDGPVLSFQRAVAFDVASGTTVWGGGTIADGRVEYFLQGNQLLRRVLDQAGLPDPAQESILFDHVDPNPNAGRSVEITFDNATQTIAFNIRVEMRSGDRTVERLASTVIHIHEVLAF